MYHSDLNEYFIIKSFWTYVLKKKEEKKQLCITFINVETH